MTDLAKKRLGLWLALVIVSLGAYHVFLPWHDVHWVIRFLAGFGMGSIAASIARAVFPDREKVPAP